MDAQRIAVLAVVLVAGSACTHGGGPSITPAGRMDEQVEGPRGTIHARYSGGMVMRTVSVSFRVDRSAFVIVGHLGGDGVIRVLYPESAMTFGDLVEPVRARKAITIEPFFAGYDGAPSLYTFTVSPFRTMAAMTDSYDGRGHGYIFLIASSAPLRYDMIVDGDEWGEVPVRDYQRASDPRIAIHKYAETLARGNFTLRFANVYNTQEFASYAATSTDCSLLSSLGLNNLHGFWGTWGLVGLSSLGYGGSHYLTNSPGCGNRYYALRDYAFLNAPSRGNSAPPTLLNPTVPPIAPTPVSRRPTYRPFGERASTATFGSFGRTIPTTRGAGMDRTGSPTGPSWPATRGLGSWASEGPIRRPTDRPSSHSPRAADRPSSIASDAGRSRSPGASASAPAARPTSPASSGTPATKPTTSGTTTTTTKHQ